MLKVEIDQGDLSRLKSACAALTSKVKTYGMDEMQRRCSVDYYQEVVGNIMKMNRPSPAYVPRYRTWKYEYGWQGYPSPWRLRGDLVASLTSFKAADGDGWVGGVPYDKKDSGGKSWFGKGAKGPSGKSRFIAMYGTVMEYGGSWAKAGTHPARPVFEPTMKEYAETGWEKRADEAIREFEQTWG